MSTGGSSDPLVLMVLPVAVAGGAGEVAINLARQAGNGYRLHVVLLQDGPLRGRLEDTGVTTTLLRPGKLRSPFAFGRTVRALSALITKTQPHVVLANEAKAFLYTRPAAARKGVPHGWFQHAHPDSPEAITRLANKLGGHFVLVASEFVAQRQRSLNPTPVMVVPLGIDIRRVEGTAGRIRARHGIPGDALVVGIVGRLQEWKGQDVFLRAAAIVADSRSDVRFAVVGGAEMGWERGDYPTDLQELADDLGISSRVIFSGQVEEVGDWYATLDLVVNVSREEPFGLVVVESMAAGVPVICAGPGGPAEIVRNGVTGVSLPSRDPRSLANAVNSLLGDSALRASMAAAGRAFAHEYHSEPRMAARFADVLCQLSGGNDARGSR